MEQDKAPLLGEHDIPPELDVYSDVRGGSLPTDVVTPTSAGILGRIFRGLGLAGTGYVGGSMLMGPWSGSGQPPAQTGAQPQARQPSPAPSAAPATRQGGPAQPASRPAAAPPTAPAEAGDRRQPAPARAALEAAENRIMDEQRERRGLSPIDIAMIQLGLGMMGSSRRSPLAAMSDAAGPALQTYVALDRNRENADLRRESERNRILRDRAMLERYDEDRALRAEVAQRNHDRMMSQFAMRGRGGGGGGRASPAERDEAAIRRALQWAATPQDEAQRRQRMAQVERMFPGSTTVRGATDPYSIRQAPTE